MHEFYIKKKKKLLKFYRKLTKMSKDILSECYPNNIVNRIVNSTETKSEKIISRLPYIGGKSNAFTPIIELNGWLICFYKAIKEEGIDVTVAVYVSREVFNKLLNKIPRFLGLQIGKLAFTNKVQGYLEKQATLSQKKIYPENFVYTFNIIKQKDKEIEFEVEFEECAVHKFYEAENVPELKMFCNFADPLYSARFEMGINADHTFAQGYSTCKLNSNNRRTTYTPKNIQKMIVDARKLMKNK